MATSGDTQVSDTTFSVVKDALIDLGVCDHNEDPKSRDFAIAKRALNRMLKALQTAGAGVAYEEEGSVSLTSGQASYTFGGTGSPDVAYRPVRMLDVRLRYSDGRDQPLTEIARRDYNAYPNKDSSGYPVVYSYWPQIEQGKLYIWPVPNVAGLSLQFSYQRAIEVFDENANEPDLPQEALDAIVLNLTARLTPTYFPQDATRQRNNERRANGALVGALSFDREDGSVFFEVESG